MLCKHFLFGEKKNYTLICSDAETGNMVAQEKKFFQISEHFLDLKVYFAINFQKNKTIHSFLTF
ncbi:hypothetical protein C7N43_19280 [Sphingobacteriales bacterium UPWRP_1]|nr:hypothetical protein BVG80_13615 [Sphingobacteriales bacterium TSM_CSM]PSJ75361.1 hypothetical protein C7N43_19280 [Sphingobacteriales bacterium UPWRP_1]